MNTKRKRKVNQKKSYQYQDVKFIVVMSIGNVLIWNLTNTPIADNGWITMIY